MAEDKIKVSEVLGELRRSARMYKIFAQAVEMAEVLDGYEKTVTSMQKTIANMEQEHTNLSLTKATLDSVIAEKKSKIDEIESSIQERIKIEKKEAGKIKAEAKEQGQKLVEAAEAKVKSTLANIETLQAEELKIRKQYDAAVEELKKVEKTIKETKESFLSKF